MNTYSKIHYLKTHCPKSQRISQLGLVTVEFAVIATAFLLVLFSIIGFANLLYIYNATVHATRLGARLAVVCDTSAANTIKAKMVAQVPGLTEIDPVTNLPNGTINIDYYKLDPSGNYILGGSAADCRYVIVSINGFKVAIAGPSSFSLGKVTIPEFSTTLVRESMNSANNSVCS